MVLLQITSSSLFMKIQTLYELLKFWFNDEPRIYTKRITEKLKNSKKLLFRSKVNYIEIRDYNTLRIQRIILVMITLKLLSIKSQMKCFESCCSCSHNHWNFSFSMEIRKFRELVTLNAAWFFKSFWTT